MGEVTQFAGAQTFAAVTRTATPPAPWSRTPSADGVITGSFSNGKTQALGEIAHGHLRQSGRTHRRGDLFATSPNSGQASSGPGTGVAARSAGARVVQRRPGTELTDLIVAQEAYTANTKVVTTTEQAVQALETMS